MPPSSRRRPGRAPWCATFLDEARHCHPGQHDRRLPDPIGQFGDANTIIKGNKILPWQAADGGPSGRGRCRCSTLSTCVRCNAECLGRRGGPRRTQRRSSARESAGKATGAGLQSRAAQCACTELTQDFHQPGEGREGPSNFHGAFLSGSARAWKSKSGLDPPPVRTRPAWLRLVARTATFCRALPCGDL